AKKLLASQNCFDCRQELGWGIHLPNISIHSVVKSRTHRIWIVVLAGNKNLHSGKYLAYSLSSLNSVQFRKTKVQQDQIGFCFVRSLNGLQSLRRLAHNAKIPLCLESRPHETAPGPEIVHHENANC